MAISSEPADGVKSVYPAAGGSGHGFGLGQYRVYQRPWTSGIASRPDRYFSC